MYYDATADVAQMFAFNYTNATPRHMCLQDLPGANVGIGTATPAAKLDVRGDIRLGSTGQLRAPGAEENLRIIRGALDYDGAILRGSGFSAQRLDVGKYRVTFDTPFSSTPTVTANCIRAIGASPAVSFDFGGPTPGQVTFVTGVGTNFEDFGVHFIAIGPR
jgi:hypothetical protein